MTVFIITLWRIVGPLVVGCQLSLQTEQVSFDRSTLLKTRHHEVTKLDINEQE